MTPTLGTSWTPRLGTTSRSWASSSACSGRTTGSSRSSMGPANQRTGPDVQDRSGPCHTERVSLALVDLRLLRYFQVVVEERNIGRAATRLLMTQPPLSRAMRQLESDLGLTLLERSHAGVRPT